MDDLVSTKQLGWLLGRSASSIRTMIKNGDIESVRIPAGYRVPREEALRLSRARVEGETGKILSDRQIERLADEVIATNERAGPG